MTLKLDFEKIEFQNRGISLINLGNVAKYWIFCAKGANANFLLKNGRPSHKPIGSDLYPKGIP